MENYKENIIELIARIEVSLKTLQQTELQENAIEMIFVYLKDLREIIED